MAQVLEKSKSRDPKVLRDTLASIEASSLLTGEKIRFGPNGQNANEASPVFQIQDEKIVILSPAANKQGDLQLVK